MDKSYIDLKKTEESNRQQTNDKIMLVSIDLPPCVN